MRLGFVGANVAVGCPVVGVADVGRVGKDVGNVDIGWVATAASCMAAKSTSPAWGSLIVLGCGQGSVQAPR